MSYTVAPRRRDDADPTLRPGTRRYGIIEYVMAHPEFDGDRTRGKLVFDLGNKAGTGEPDISVSWQSAPERIHLVKGIPR